MPNTDIIPFDLQRMFLGDMSWLFLLEIAVRTIIIYAYFLVLLRLIAKRGVRQLSFFEVAIIVALGSAVGDPMFYPEVPLLHSMLVITIVVGVERAVGVLVSRSKRIAVLLEGEPRQIVGDGKIDMKSLQGEELSTEEVLEMLRLAGIEQLGEVKRAFLEQSGSMSTFRYEPQAVRPGLPIIPPWDVKRPPSVRVGTTAPIDGLYACSSCGYVLPYQAGDPLTACPNCGNDEWMRAVTDALAEGDLSST